MNWKTVQTLQRIYYWLFQFDIEGDSRLVNAHLAAMDDVAQLMPKPTPDQMQACLKAALIELEMIYTCGPYYKTAQA